MTDVSDSDVGWAQMDDATLAQVLHAANPDGLWITDDRGITSARKPRGDRGCRRRAPVA